MKKAFIAVVGRGGVGKSMVAKELSCIYSSRRGFSSKENTRVLLIDTNFSFSTQAKTCGIDSLQYDFIDLVSTHRKLDLTREEYALKYDWSYLQKYLAYLTSKNLYVLCADSSRGAEHTLRPDTLSRPEAMTIYQALGELFDVIIVDCNNGCGGEVLAAMMLATTIVFMSEDSTVSHKKIMRLRRELITRDYGSKLTGSSVLICNKVDTEHTFMNPEFTSEYLDLPLAAQLPFIKGLYNFTADSMPVSGRFPEIGRPLYRLAGEMVREEIPYEG